MAASSSSSSKQLLLVLIITISFSLTSSFSLFNLSSSSVPFSAHPSFNSGATADSPCNDQNLLLLPNSSTTLKLHLKHTKLHQGSLLQSAHKDSLRIHTLAARSKNNYSSSSSYPTTGNNNNNNNNNNNMKMMAATLESGVSLGSGEYFMDVYIGTPPRHFSLILDTGSDLNWIQCSPCITCFDQHGPIYDPSSSSSYRNVSCADHDTCSLVTSPDPTRSCPNKAPDDTCPYFYWYGDNSNTTGDLAVEVFTLNLTSGAQSHDVVFGCGHWNRGLFHGAAGLLGLGRGPLSFASQLRYLYGHTFSYCLVDRNSDLSVRSKLVFGDDQSLVNHNYTSFAKGKESPDTTFYYVSVKGIRVGGELLPIESEDWELAKDGTGGTIIDSGTTLSYFVDPAYQVIKNAFLMKVKYPVVEDFPVLSPCYNVSGIETVEMPGFSVEFADGAVWEFPLENYFIRLEPEGIMCLALLGTPRSSLSIIGNYQQQNFHVLYDTNKSRLGFAPMRCAEV